MAEINLKDFIVEAISQIADGIIDAQKSNSSKGCVINPKIIQTIGTNITYMHGPKGESRGTVSILNFDLVIDINEKTGGGGGIKVRTGILNVGAEILLASLNRNFFIL